jgi:hypothetical protein
MKLGERGRDIVFLFADYANRVRFLGESRAGKKDRQCGR